MGPAGWPRLGEGRGETGVEGKGGVRHSCHLPGAGGLEGKRLLTTPGERTAEENSHGEVSGAGDTWGQGLLQASPRMNQKQRAWVKGELSLP